jgi:hypothetical protein
MNIELIADRANDNELRAAADAYGARFEYDHKAAEIAAARVIVEAIKALPAWAASPAAIGHICCVLSTKVQHSGWGHTTEGEDAQASLDQLHDWLENAK